MGYELPDTAAYLDLGIPVPQDAVATASPRVAQFSRTAETAAASLASMQAAGARAAAPLVNIQAAMAKSVEPLRRALAISAAGTLRDMVLPFHAAIAPSMRTAEVMQRVMREWGVAGFIRTQGTWRLGIVGSFAYAWDEDEEWTGPDYAYSVVAVPNGSPPASRLVEVWAAAIPELWARAKTRQVGLGTAVVLVFVVWWLGSLRTGQFTLADKFDQAVAVLVGWLLGGMWRADRDQ